MVLCLAVKIPRLVFGTYIEEEEERRSRYNMLALDIDMLENDIAHEIFFNSKGHVAVPGNKMAALDFKEYYTKERNYEHARNTYFPHLKPKPVEPGRKKHSQRRREKKIMERRLEEMRQQLRRPGEDPAAIIVDEPQDAPDSKRAQIAENMSARNRALEWLRNARPSNGGKRGKFTKKRS